MKKSLPALLVKDNHYWVPCIPIPDIFSKSFSYLSLEDGWVPVLSAPHIDRETAFTIDTEGQQIESPHALHYHVDVRFIKADLPIGGSVGVSAKLFGSLLDVFDFETPNDEIDDLIEWYRKKCYRVSIDDFENSLVPSMYETGVISEGLRLTDKKVCPHQKTCLRGIPQSNNTVVCPAHGLRWDILSGNLIPRKKLNNTLYGIGMTEGHREMLEFADLDYAVNFAKQNVIFEIWSQLPVPIFAYFDRITFEADRGKYL